MSFTQVKIILISISMFLILSGRIFALDVQEIKRDIKSMEPSSNGVNQDNSDQDDSNSDGGSVSDSDEDTEVAQLQLTSKSFQ